MKQISKIRRHYNKGKLSIHELNSNPIKHFKQWLNEAIEAECLEPTALSLATVDRFRRPSNRIVLLKEITDKGFAFFTNYNSTKGKQISDTQYASMNFYWAELERQVRIEGKISKIDHVLSETYFHSRPRESQIGAWASNQSEKINHENDLDEQYKMAEKKYNSQPIPCPPHWGGYILEPDMIEFWQGKDNRMHDRFIYELESPNNWLINRVAP